MPSDRDEDDDERVYTGTGLSYETPEPGQKIDRGVPDNSGIEERSGELDERRERDQGTDEQK